MEFVLYVVQEPEVDIHSVYLTLEEAMNVRTGEQEVVSILVEAIDVLAVHEVEE